MNNEDKKEFARALDELGTIHDKIVTNTMRDSYWEVLKDMTIDEFRRAFLDLKRNSQWYPKPTNFRSSARTKGWL